MSLVQEYMFGSVVGLSVWLPSKADRVDLDVDGEVKLDCGSHAIHEVPVLRLLA